MKEKKKSKKEKFNYKEFLNEDTLLVSWVNDYKRGFELRCNSCEQFPKGYYEYTTEPDNKKEAKNLLYKKLIGILQ